jgi:hypothetical protein
MVYRVGGNRELRQKSFFEKAIRSSPPNRYEALYGELDDEGRALAELLAKDGYLYSNLHINWDFYAKDENNMMDLKQDFFLDITYRASRIRNTGGTFIGVVDLQDYPHGQNWVFKAFRRFAIDHWRLQVTRIQKPYNGERPKEETLGCGHEERDRRENRVSRISKISLELYLRDKGMQFPGRTLEEAEEVTYRPRLIRTAIERVMGYFSKSEQVILEHYFLENKNISTIVKETQLSRNCVDSHLCHIKRKMQKLFPSDIWSTTAWARMN